MSFTVAATCSSPTSFSPCSEKSFTSCLPTVSSRMSVLDEELSSRKRRFRRLTLKTSFGGNRERLMSEDHHGKDFRVLRAVDVRSSAVPRQLRVMIAGAPASGKGTQCELIVKKFGLTHISAGDLLRAEVASGTEPGRIAATYMNDGKLVPSDIVVTMVKNRLAKPDAIGGWLLDGYPRSLEQAEALEAVGIRPQLFILLDVPDSILVERVVGRRSDPVTGKIYHLTFSPPESEEIASRLEQRSDDKEEKVKSRVDTHNANVDSVIGVYKDVVKMVDGNRPKREVFADIESFLSALLMEGSPAL